MYMAYNAPHAPYDYPDHSEIKEFENMEDERAGFMKTLFRFDQMIGRLVSK